MKPVSILVVEDESIVAEDIRERLTKMGTRVVGPVATGEHAVQVAGREHPDIVLMDIRLKGRLDGVAAGDQIRRRFHIPVVYLTAHSDESTLGRAMQTEPQGYVHKPFEENDLRVNIELALSKHAMEERLRESEQRYATTLSSIGDAVIATDNDCRITFMNPVAERLTNWDAKDAMGCGLEDVFHIIHEHSRQVQPSPLVKALRDGLPTDLEGPTLLITKEGREVPIDDCAAPIFDHDRKLRGGVVVFRDITEKRRAAETQRRAQEHIHWLDRLNAIGRFAGGMAHEINNMLTVVLGCSELLLSQLSTDHALRPTLDTMLAVGDRTAALTRQLLAFSRKQHLAPARLDLNQVLRRMEVMFARLLGSHIEVVMRLDHQLQPVNVDCMQWEQVLVNLAINAQDAMPRGGTLTLETRNVHVDESFAEDYPEMRPGDYVLLSVRDTGIGMDQATQAHIFEPFFTTKEIGKGTGLGLATVYGIVTQSGGHIFVESTPGHGAKFSLYLPADPHAAPVAHTEPPALHIPHGSETILLTEDEEPVRNWVSLALRGLGYTVLEAPRGQDALDLAQRFAGPIHLLLTDVAMPKMLGPDLARQLTAQRPDTRVLYMSGFADETIFPAELREGATFLQKPFTLSTLATKLRSVLEV